jgi:hypothetical protein
VSLSCAKCGHTSSSPQAKFCSRCGSPLSSDGAPATKSKSPNESGIEAATPEGAIICRARCAQSKKPFAIKFERGARGVWFARSSWPIEEKKVRASVFSSGSASGSFKKHKDYPGCPHCGNTLWRSCFECNSGLGCLEYGSPLYVCPWCGAESKPRWGRSSNRAISMRGARD